MRQRADHGPFGSYPKVPMWELRSYSGRPRVNMPGARRSGKIPRGRNGFMFPPQNVTRLDAWRLIRRFALFPFRRILRGPRTLGIGMAGRARAGKDVTAGLHSDRCFFPPFSTRQLRRSHFAVAICLAAFGRISGGLCRHRYRSAARGDSPMARSPRNGPAIFPAAFPPATTSGKRATLLRTRFSVSADSSICVL